MIDTKKFHDELIDLWDNFYDTDGVYDIIFLTDDYIEVKCENKKVANQFADDIMAYYNAMICYDFRKGNGCYQFSISPSLMIRESKKSATKSIKESSVRCVTFEQIVDSRFDDISKGEKILNNRKDEIIEFCGDDFSVYTKKIEFLDWGDDESQYRQRYYIRKNNNNVSWNDLYEIVNSVKAVPYKFDKINDSVFESRKSIKESINGDCYIYYDDDDNKRLVFCDYIKGITDTRNWFYLNEYIIDAIHIFKNEKQAQKFIDEHLKYFADQDKVVIAEYPQTVSGFFESKESARKSIKEFKDSYKVKVLNEMLDAMAKDEYNIPKVGIYGVTKNINLDIGAIQLLIDYYK